MKDKIFKSLLISVLALFLFAGSSFAATSVRLQSPSANTNNTSLSLTFVAQTTTTSDVNVQCYKQGPSDGGLNAVGSAINLSNPGNTSTCNFNLDQGNGTYQFKVIATAGSETANSDVVSTNYNNSKPGTPQYIGKDKISACVNRIKFKTADDGGKTVKVEIYRADKTTFDVNDGSKLGTVTVGSNEYREYDDTLVSCDTVFYYALRAFDIFGNASDVVGDSNVTFNVTNPTTVTQEQGAIPVSGNGTGGTGSVGTGTSGEKSGEVLGTESAQPTTPAEKTLASQNPIANGVNWISNNKLASFVILLVILGLAYFLFRRYKK